MAETESFPFTTKDWVLAALAVILALLALPLLAAIGLTLQFGFLVGVPALLACVLLWPKARAALSKTHTIPLRGIQLAADVLVSPTHSWVRSMGNRVARIGADDFLQRVLGPVDCLELPPVGARVRRGDTLVRLRQGQRELAMLSPVNGIVRRSHQSLIANPSLINGSPFDDGWLVELNVSDATQPVPGLRSLAEVIPWMRGHIDRLVALSQPELGAAVWADGGQLAPDLARRLDAVSWDLVKNELFS